MHSVISDEKASTESLRDDFVAAMGAAATGVTVVTAHAERPVGQTVSAMCSVSADPPLLLVCVNRRSPLIAAIDESGSFCVNVLGDLHSDIADTFAGRPRVGRPWDFSCGSWNGSAVGAPRLRDGVASFACHYHTALSLGSHMAIVGLVRETIHGHGTPLVYAHRAYGRPTHLD